MNNKYIYKRYPQEKKDSFTLERSLTSMVNVNRYLQNSGFLEPTGIHEDKGKIRSTLEYYELTTHIQLSLANDIKFNIDTDTYYAKDKDSVLEKFLDASSKAESMIFQGGKGYISRILEKDPYSVVLKTNYSTDFLIWNFIKNIFPGKNLPTRHHPFFFSYRFSIDKDEITENDMDLFNEYIQNIDEVAQEKSLQTYTTPFKKTQKKATVKIIDVQKENSQTKTSLNPWDIEIPTIDNKLMEMKQ